jgi:integrase
MRTRPLPPHLKRWFDPRTRKTYVAFRKRGHKTVPLPQPIGSDAFWTAYNAALKGKADIGAGLRSAAGSVNASIAAYLCSHQWDGMADGTRGAHLPALERFREPYGSWPLRQLTENFLRAYLDSLTLSAARKALAALRGWLVHAKHDVTRGIKLPRAKSDKHPSWPAEWIAKYEACHAIGTKARLCFAIAKCTGLGRNEIARIGPQHIEDGEITITRKKTGVPVTITVQPELRTILDATPLTGFSTFLVNSIGKPYAPNDLSIQFRRWCDEAGIPPQYTLHGLRHRMGDTIATLGGSLHEVAYALGHRDVKTAAHYTQEADRKLLSRRAMRRVIEGTKQDRSGNEGVSVDRFSQTHGDENM